MFAIMVIVCKKKKNSEKTHPAFAEALREAAKAGIYVLAYDCMVWEDHVQMTENFSCVELRVSDVYLFGHFVKKSAVSSKSAASAV